MSKLFTRTGDEGITFLANGKRIKKNSILINLIGNLDELNTFLGFAGESLYSLPEFKDLLTKVYRVQGELFELGAALCSGKKYMINSMNLSELESEIDFFSANLPIIDNFILPGGGECAARFHVARAICRRVERNAFEYSETNSDGACLGKFLNRLSSWLFVLARYISYKMNIEEISWKG